MYFEDTYPIDTREVDHQNQCRPSAVLGFLQETATTAAVRLGVSREEMLAQYNCFWMLARIWVQLDKPLLWGEDVMVRTWHRTPKGAAIYRDFDLFQNGSPVGQAVSTWVLADYDTHRLFRMDKVAQLRDSDGGEGLNKTMLLSHLKLPPNMTQTETRRLHYSETDMNSHVNNTRYADFACDALRMETLTGGEFVSELRIGFLAECRAGDVLTLSVGEEDGLRYVQGAGQDGTPRFDAALRVSR